MPATEEPALAPRTARNRDIDAISRAPDDSPSSPPSGDPPPRALDVPPENPTLLVALGEVVEITDAGAAAPGPESKAEASERSETIQNLGSRAMTLLAVLAVLYTVYFARAVLLPMAFGVVLSLVFRPVVRWMSRRRIPEFVGAGICLVGLLMVAGFGIGKLIGPAQEWMAQAPGHFRAAEAKLHDLMARVNQISQAKDEIEEIAAGENEVQPVPVEVQQPKLGSSALLLSTGGSVVASLVVVIVLAFFLLTSGDALINNVLTTLPKLSDKKRIVALIQEVQRGVSTYLFTMSAINVGLAIAVSFAMWLIGMPNPALWGALAGILNYVPYIGPLVCGAIIGFVSVLTFETLSYAAVAPITFFVITSIEGNVLTPAILGRHMSLNPIMVFLFLIFWGWMWGVGGAVLAVPILAVLRITFDQFERTQPLGTMLGA